MLLILLLFIVSCQRSLYTTIPSRTMNLQLQTTKNSKEVLAALLESTMDDDLLS